MFFIKGGCELLHDPIVQMVEEDYGFDILETHTLIKMFICVHVYKHN